MFVEESEPPRFSAVERLVVAPEPPTGGGGGTTFALSAVPVPPRLPRALPEGLPPVTLGGGGTIFALREVPLPFLAPPTVTDGGGGTTSVVPNIFPSRLLTIDPVPACVGGGGTTVRAGSGMLPLASRCRS